MKAMLLAAGRGVRMRPLTDHTPKPLLKIQGRALIEHQLLALAAAGITEVVINVAYRGEQIIAALKDGAEFGLQIHYSQEPEHQPLGTAGGIYQVLSQLGEQPFLVLSTDIWTDYPFEQLMKPITGLAHLVLVTNPPEHPQGDFGLKGNRVSEEATTQYTYASIAVFDPRLFANPPADLFTLNPLLQQAIRQGQVSGELYQGRLVNVSNPQQLAAL